MASINCRRRVPFLRDFPFFKLFKFETAQFLDPEGLPSLQDDAPETIGLLSTPELDTVVAECSSHVARIAKQCNARNLRYRDIDFDVENDQDRCLNGLVVTEAYNPSDVQRVPELFENPRPRGDIHRQRAGWWRNIALRAMDRPEYTVSSFGETCDGLLYTAVPKYEELSAAEKALFQNDKERYNASARNGSKTLYFAKSGTVGETWVPLAEKAYAKLHGDYGSLGSGYASEGVEDLTGGVSSFIQCKDIVDPDKFWKDELLYANQDRLFACSFQGLSPTRNGNFNATISGLWGQPIVFCVADARAEWSGPWSDGSKDWTPACMDVLPILGHVFCGPGKFVMEYKDFCRALNRLFDSWTMRCDVLLVPPRPFPGSAFGYGYLCFSFSLSKTTFAIIVLSQLDVRYFKGIAPPCYWNFDFILFKKGQKEPIDTSSHSRFTSRSVSLEFPDLEEGEYIVHCRLDKTNTDEWSPSKLARVISERAISESVATNFEADIAVSFHEKNLPIPVDILVDQDLADLSRKALHLTAEKKRRATPDAAKPESISSSSEDVKTSTGAPNTTTTITTITTVREPSKVTTNTKRIVLFGGHPIEPPMTRFRATRHPQRIRAHRVPKHPRLNHPQTTALLS
ncbi:hypothetical protein FB451DRAFT_1395096 [Mycena latifolia]|nr:hypothetical protein FB451DRAFT_1395096 [Mycena latifolia]